jgi:hypothetical protein
MEIRMAEKAARLDSLIVSKGGARPVSGKKTALTVKLDPDLYQRLLDHVAKHRPQADDPRSVSNQSVMVAALEAYLNVHG